VRLAPGETQIVTFTLPVEKLAFLDRAMQWRVEPGAYEVRVGGSSADTHAASFEITG
jgi:beta-glucosidase